MKSLDWVRIDNEHAVPAEFWGEWLGEPGEDLPDLRIEFRAADGRVECVAVSVIARPDGREVRTGDIQKVSIDDLREWAVSQVAVYSRSEGDALHMLGPSGRAGVRAMNKARRRVNPGTLKEVAKAYTEAESAPVLAVQELLDVERRAAYLWIKRARENIDPDTGKPYLESEEN